ncbi:hypothetical protein VIBNISFn27_1010023 [Vibrio nigripulchritudo SFn27]|uniref:Uncharacterized protein n=1 Tax=Vibrio nigripulchritudo TaxID=28173 RepID=U4JV17_9VIBR|nr:hypothetical protein [Vibrio nigripulchritudo]CCN83142.1 hypothetical protein VIBNIBLFn1_560051 [Vibrio nigripulchritudo BLFn1]CCN86254.1 hypothetical protein VIBNISFn27_1010023 [Vibrio nigripulchritudo SFn27]CCN92814.1 hypothetical protein VIBNIENn2_1070114 [Vibrio nigripulchritudo ENn2]CCO42750.1 hypothetical protein VIBNISFn135_840050 [Vibrio nigripulchritudo SFn135]CCO52617.1 hypothetical protein VIBNIWn13_360050 [Vibrio nigripulchritudo Wn13]
MTHFKQQKICLIGSTALFLFLTDSVYSDHLERHFNALITNCNAPVIDYHQTIGLGSGANQGKNIALESHKYSSSHHFSTIDYWLAEEIRTLGISKQCADYLVSRSEVSLAEEPHLLAYVTFPFTQDELTQESDWVLNFIAKAVSQNPSSLALQQKHDGMFNHLSVAIVRTRKLEAHFTEHGIDLEKLTSSSGE